MSGRGGRGIPPGQVSFGDFGGTEPIGRAFGGDRGKPLDRYYIEDFLHRHAADIRGRVAEIGEDLYTSAIGGERVRRCEIVDAPESRNPHAAYLGDLQTGEGLPKNAFDCILLVQTLHMLYDVRGAVDTAHRALAPGGVVLATVPGITSIDAQDGPGKWFWPMTQTAARRVFADRFGADNVSVEQYGNVLAATAFLQGLAREEVPREKLDVVDPLYPVITGVRARKA